MSTEEPTALAFSRQEIRAGKASPITESLVRIIDAQARELADAKAQLARVEAYRDRLESQTPQARFYAKGIQKALDGAA
ncbi:hypothetical protein [Paeniglutamicibacter terrestris]|uniref:Uncharacterized protein n=1 Tax=Paeniglutamicibacter terrestris TaxID=2723403 RepID=A0ABX1G4H7_9MICC|nr:hypothetical protein [Paeniglutamicibacter terrestris]NKG21134.1 hypothetical protein [Paeniglutamicibacter terrestris]